MYCYFGPKAICRKTIITDNEALWLMRMCVGEGGRDCSVTKATAMMWAMINRWTLHPGRKRWPSFLFMIRRFSQPINPRWQTGGDLAIKFANHKKPKLRKFASPERLRRRKKICSLQLHQIPEQIRKTVEQFQSGKLYLDSDNIYNQQRISNWASLPSTPKRFPWGFDIDGDWFFEDKQLIEGFVIWKEE